MFGRNKDSCDFPLPHQSCSRQHAALVYHKHLKRPFLMDLGSSKFEKQYFFVHLRAFSKLQLMELSLAR